MPKQPKQYVGFVYGGPLKASVCVFFHTTENVNDFVRDNLVRYYGKTISGRFVKCDNAEELYEEVLEKALEQQSGTETHAENILKLNVNTAATVIKECSGNTRATQIKIVDVDDDEEEETKPKKTAKKTAKKTEKKPAKKTSKKKVQESDDEESGDEAEEGEGEGESEDEAGSGNDSEDDAGADSDEEDPAPKKSKGKGKKGSSKKTSKKK